MLNFRGRAAPRAPAAVEKALDANLAKYERDESADDYRHRMTVNVVAFVFIVGLILGGLWIADTMARMRKNQDCVLSGRPGCTPVEVNRDRW